MAEQDPWDDLLHDITGSICNEKCSRKNADILPFRELVPIQPTRPLTKEKCRAPPLSKHGTSRSATTGQTCVDTVPRRSDMSLALPTPIIGMDNVYVCSLCHGEFRSSTGLRGHKRSRHVISTACTSTSSKRIGSLPPKPDLLLDNSSAGSPRTRVGSDGTTFTIGYSGDSSVSQAFFMASLGLQAQSGQDLAPLKRAMPLLTIPPPLIDFGSPTRQPPPPLTPQPKTPKSLISQLVRSPAAKSSGPDSAFFAPVDGECSDESSSSDDDGLVECQVQLTDIMKSSGKANGIPARTSSPNQVTVTTSIPSLLQSAAFSTPLVSSGSSPVTFPRWIFGIDISSPLGLRVMASFGMSDAGRMGPGTAVVTGCTAGTIVSRTSAAEPQKLRERDAPYPVVYRQPRRQKHVHTYHFRSRRGKPVSCGVASQPADSGSLLPRIPVGSQSQVQACSVGICRHSPSVVTSRAKLKECSVSIGISEREAADSFLQYHQVSNEPGRYQNHSTFPSVSNCDGYPESWQFSDKGELPLSVQVSEEVYTELMVLRDVLKRTVFRNESCSSP